MGGGGHAADIPVRSYHSGHLRPVPVGVQRGLERIYKVVAPHHLAAGSKPQQVRMAVVDARVHHRNQYALTVRAAGGRTGAYVRNALFQVCGRGVFPGRVEGQGRQDQQRRHGQCPLHTLQSGFSSKNCSAGQQDGRVPRMGTRRKTSCCDPARKIRRSSPFWRCIGSRAGRSNGHAQRYTASTPRHGAFP